MMTSRFPVAAALWFGFAWSAHAADPLKPGETPAACGQGGIVHESSGTPANFDVYFTDANMNRFPNPIRAGVAGVLQPNGRYEVDIPVPPTPGACDARNVTHHPKVAGGGGGAGGVLGVATVADLSLESLYLGGDGLVHIEGTFSRLGSLVGSASVSIPDLYSAQVTPDANSVFTLYSLVDFRQFIPASPVFTLGEDFSIVGGASALLPGMMFSTTPFTFSAAGGPAGTPFTGTAEVLTEHDPTIPEPASLVLLASGLLGLAAARRRGPA